MRMPHYRTIATIAVTLLGWTASTGWAQSGAVEPHAGTWKTHVLASGSELRLPAPPAAPAAQAELGELRALAGQRSAAVLDQINYWDAGSTGYRWNEIAMSQGLRRIGKIGPHGNYRMMTLLNVAIYDATVAAWDSKYEHNRRRPSETDSTLTTALPNSRSPSYPSEHAAAAGAAAAVLTYVMADDAQLFAAKADEAARSRLLAGTEFPSDVKAGLELGRKVGERVIARARADGFDVPWTGTVPTEPGKWTGTNPNFPRAGSWKTWIAPWDGKSSLPEPPAWNSPEMTKAVAEMKAFKPTGQPNAIFWPDDPAGRPAPDQGPNHRADRVPLREAEPSALGATALAEGLRIPLGPERAGGRARVCAHQHRLVRHHRRVLGNALPRLVSAAVPDRLVNHTNVYYAQPARLPVRPLLHRRRNLPRARIPVPARRVGDPEPRRGAGHEPLVGPDPLALGQPERSRPGTPRGRRGHRVGEGRRLALAETIRAEEGENAWRPRSTGSRSS
jgi:hypothetical protein